MRLEEAYKYQNILSTQLQNMYIYGINVYVVAFEYFKDAVSWNYFVFSSFLASIFSCEWSFAKSRTKFLFRMQLVAKRPLINADTNPDDMISWPTK